MRNIIRYILIALMMGLFQTAFLPELFSIPYIPNLILAFGWSLFFKKDPGEAYKFVFIGGLLLDLFGNSYIGVSSSLLLFFLLATLFIRKFFFRGNTLHIFSVLASYLSYSFIINNTFDPRFFVGALLTLIVSFLL